MALATRSSGSSTGFALQIAVVLVALSETRIGLSLQTPLTINVQRNWRIPANKAVGQFIDRVRVDRGVDLSKVTFELGESAHLDGSDFFRIDPKTGNIYLDESLEDHVDQEFYLFVKASTVDGPTSSLEVRVFVEPPDEGANGGPPRLSAPRPGLPFNPNPPPDDDDDTAENDNVEPPKGSRSRNRNKQRGKEKNPAVVVVPENVIVDKFPNSTESSVSPKTPPKSSTTVPVSTVTTTPTETPGVTRNASSGIPGVEATNLPAGRDQQPNVDMTLTIVPIIVVVGTAPLVGLIVWILRRKHNMKKDSSDTSVRFKTSSPQQKKEVSGEMNSVDTTDESSRGESSIVTSPSGLMHWHRALSNRYESTGPGEESAPALTEQSKWEFPRHHLRILGILGEGCFGQVWKCEALNVGDVEGTTTVAVKTLKENAGEREKRDLLSELEVMKMLTPHPNIVTLLGCCTIKEPVFVILEYVQHGKLQSYLRASRAEHYYGNLHGKSSHLTSRDLTSFAFQVSKGMDYLTSKGIIHRDLAARNVLVGEKNICKVADFGFARDLVGNGVYERKSEGRLPIRWMAPESLYDNIFTAKTDVWSFGVLMWEIVTLGSTPYPGMAAGDVMRKVRDGYRLEKPDHCRREIYNIMYYCWDRDPKERPNFSELTQLLDQLLMSETDYIELDRFPDHAYYNIISNMSGEKL